MADDVKTGTRYAFKKTQFGVVVDGPMLLLEEREVISGEPAEDFVRFVGAGQIDEQAKVGALQVKIQGQVPFTMPNATTAEEAIEQAPVLFEIAKKQFIEQAKAQAARQIITQPGAVPPQPPGFNGPTRRFA